MTDQRRCLVVDGHPTMRIGVRGILGDRFNVEEAADGDDALALLTSLGGFEVAIVELAAGNGDGRLAGIPALRALHDAHPGLAIIAHDARAERRAATQALEAGATAYVAKSSPAGALERAVEAAIRAERFVDPAACGTGADSALTPRQRQILQLLADGNSTAAAARRLGLSAETIRTHTKAALARLRAKDRAHAVAVAIRSGLID